MIKIFKLIKKLFLFLIIIIVVLAGVVCGIAFAKYDGNIKKTLVNLASHFTAKVETRYVLIMGVSEDISAELTDTIILSGYNPETQKAFIVSIPRDTFVGQNKSRATASEKS